MVLRKYIFPLTTMILMIGLLYINEELGKRAIEISSNSILEMMTFIPPVFVLLGLLDVWVPKEMMIKFLGERSGLMGIVLSFIMGSAAAGPLYGAFPIVAVLMKKGAKFSNVLIFIGAWSTTKIPMFTFELTSLGPRFAFTRLIVDIIGIIIIAYVINGLVSKKTIDDIYSNSENL